jgi:diguanylate cyclase (GGDEF)-like protein
VAATLRGAVRTGDILSRWGGEEFCVLVESSDEAGLVDAGERLRVLVSRSETRVAGLSQRVEVSVGGALAHDGDTAETIFARADKALYSAKEGGRNRVAIAPPV